MEADSEDTIARRTALKRIGVVGAALWVAPVIDQIVIGPQTAQAASGGNQNNQGGNQGGNR